MSEKYEALAIRLADAAALTSTCVRDKVGAVCIQPDTWDVVSVGFNGTAPGQLNCDEGGCPRALRDCVSGSPYMDEDECLHAEDNCLQRAGTAARGAWLVTTRQPCGNCRRRALTAGISRIVVK